jgi:MFS family permease
MSLSVPEPRQLGLTEWAIIVVAIIGFAFDIYELLMMPLIAGPALADLLKVPLGDPLVRQWVGYIFWSSAMAGGVFGLLGGWLTDRYGRRRVLVWSILIYSLSALAAGFSTSAPMLLFFRCTTFIGVCVEFVAAVAWLAELFPNPRQREKVLGFTQAFSSVGGLLVTGANILAVKYAASLPAIYGGHTSWRYTLISGLLPALPLLFIRPFLPESPAWAEKHRAGTLRRPSLRELWSPELRRVTCTTTLLFACAYGAAFGAIQLVPSQIVPGLPSVQAAQAPLGSLKRQEARLQIQIRQAAADHPQKGVWQRQLEANQAEQKKVAATAREVGKQTGNRVQLYQELGGLTGRILLAVLALVVVSRVRLLRLFLWPGLILIPLVFVFPAQNDVELLKWGMFLAGLLTVAQFSFWGNYLPQAYPVHLRGTGESFAANVGGRMLGTSAAFITTNVLAPHMPGGSSFTQVAFGAAIMVAFVYAVAILASRFLPEPKPTGPE